MNTLILITLKTVEYQLLGCVLVGVWYFMLGVSRLSYLVFLRDFDWESESLSERVQTGILTIIGLIVCGLFLWLIVYGLWQVVGVWINLNWSLINLL